MSHPPTRRRVDRRLRASSSTTAEPVRPAWDNTEALLAIASLHGDDDLDGDDARPVVVRRDGTIDPGPGCRPALSGTRRRSDPEARPESQVRPGAAGGTEGAP